MAGKRDGFKDFILDQLADLRGVTAKAMFGGYGLYRDQTFFGIVHKGRLYFRTDRTSRATYLTRGMKPFRPNAKQTLKTYYEVPVEIIEDREQLAQLPQFCHLGVFFRPLRSHNPATNRRCLRECTM